MSGNESEAGDDCAPPAPLIPSLPDDLALNCLARVPIQHHRTLSAVSRPIRALLSSPLFFSTRALSGSSEPLLHLCLRSHNAKNNSPSISWFALRHNPGRGTRALSPLPPLPAPSSVGAAYAASGPFIYALGGSLSDLPSPSVWILDCRTRSWRPGPTMRLPREFAAAGAVGNCVYVLGGCGAGSPRWAEALHPDENQWRAVPSPPDARGLRWMHASAVLGSRVFAMADRGGVVFDTESGEWGEVGEALDSGWRGRACVIGGAIFCYDYLGKIRGFDVDGGDGFWRMLEVGGGGVLPKFLCGATMANSGGRLVVAWEEKGSSAYGSVVEIWCAEIEVKKTRDGRFLGTIRWSDKVLSAPRGSSIVHCVAVSL